MIRQMGWFLAAVLMIAGILFGSSTRKVTTSAATLGATEPGLGTPPPPRKVQIVASDGLKIVGLFYPSMLSGRQAPGALLLHQLNGTKKQFDPLVPALQVEGYAVLAVDLRGFGETGGEIFWKQADSDTQTLLQWLREIPAIDGKHIAIIGASMGANLALRGCAADPDCRAVIALSPGVEYFGIRTDTVIDKLKDKAVLLVASISDSESAQGVRKLTTLAQGNIMTRLYVGWRHGIEFFAVPDAMPMMIQWLESYNQPE